jgi:hypothetical protein
MTLVPRKIEPCRDPPEGSEMRQRGRSEQPVKGRRADRPKTRKVSTAAPSITDLQEQIGNLTRELKEAQILGFMPWQDFRVIFDRRCEFRMPFDVCFSPKAT